MENLIGMDLGRYHILEPLGQGGMASVYKAYDTRLEREVAVKIIRTELFGSALLNQLLKRFEREAKGLARLIHPNIVSIIDYGEHDGTPYLVMPYLQGGSLKQRLNQPLSWQVAAHLLLPVARALQYTHEQGVIHRDVKPSNILITPSGEPLLTDFGIAKILDLEEGLTLTGTGVGMGTPEYMAPEQWVGKVTPQSDIYSLGVVFYEMVTARKPYTADTPAAVLLKQTNDPLPRPRQFVPGLPERVEKVLFKALAKKPEERYESMAAFAQALEDLTSRQTASGEKAVAAKIREVPELQNEPDTQATVDQRVIPIIPSAPNGQEKPSMKTTNDKTSSPTKPADNILPAGFGENISYPPGWLPVFRRTWVIVLIVLGLAVFGILGGWLLSKPAGLSAYRNPTNTQTPTNMPVPSETLTATSTFTPVDTATPSFTPTPTLGIGSTWTRPADGMGMVYVPVGDFTMGESVDQALAECKKLRNDCNTDYFADEKPPHTIRVSAFWIDKTLVTNAMYAGCVKTGACQPPHDTKSSTRASYYGNSKYDNYPVIYVNWNQVNTYCQWAGARLPTEAEWEKAARGTDGRTYPWGNENPTCTLANYSGCMADMTAVDAHPTGASPYGVLDMAGNVWQWMADWYDSRYYASSPSSNPSGASSGTYRVLRGGSWIDDVYYVRSAVRGWYVPDGSYNNFGFRCSRPAD